MTPNEAINLLDELKTIYDSMFQYSTFYMKALDMAIDALKKQVPTKPVGEHYAHMRCPSCNHRIRSGMGSSSRRRDNWCNYCGQKILWRGDDADNG